MQVNIVLGNKVFYMVLVLIALVATTLIAYAYGSADPAALGHTAGELIVSGVSIVQDSIFGVDVANNTLTGIHVQNDSIGGSTVNESTLGIVPIANNCNSCDNDGTCEIETADITNWYTQSIGNGNSAYAEVGSLKFQWGAISGGSPGEHTINFPVSFSTVYQFYCTLHTTGTFTLQSTICHVVTVGTSSATVGTMWMQWPGTNGDCALIRWFAVGV